MKIRLILASGSNGRRTLLESLKIPFEIVESNVDEEKIQDDDPIQLACRRAEAKAEEIVRRIMNYELRIKNKKLVNDHDSKFMIHDSVLLLGADTVGFMGDWVFGKPKSREEAREMLQRFSGKTHKYVSAFCVIRIDNSVNQYIGKSVDRYDGKKRKTNTDNTDLPIYRSTDLPKITGYDVSSVTFRKLTKEDIDLYLDRVEYLKLAGAFKINDSPQNFVTKVDGSISNIIGISLEKLVPILKDGFLL